MNVRFRILSGLLLVGLASLPVRGGVARAESPLVKSSELDSAFARLRSSPGFDAEFVETKRLSLVKAPLESSGSLHFARPGLLSKRTAHPRASVLVLEGTRLTVSDERSTKVIELRDQPALRPLLECLPLFLAGDRAGLERHFVLTSEKGASAGELRVRLDPKSEELKALLLRVEFTLREKIPERIGIFEKSGDVTEMRIHSAKLDHAHTEDEKRRLFSPKP